jgi:phage N-6-adenine-methyltransferase
MTEASAIVVADGSSLVTTRVVEARALLALARGTDDVLEMRNQAVALAEYTKLRADASGAHADAWEIVQYASRRLGELLRELPQHPTGGGRPRKLDGAADAETSNAELPVSKGAELKRLGITRMQASRYEKLASLPAQEFSARVEAGRAKVERQAEPDKLAAVTAASEHDGDAWGTPERYLDAARDVLGDIDLDPASNPTAQARVRAARFHTREDDGLKHEWIAKSLWLNPPYSSPLVGEFMTKLLSEYAACHFVEGIALVNACTEVGWFQRLMQPAAVCFPDHRIAFLDAQGNPVPGNAHRQAFLYLGAKLPKFRKRFREFGEVMVSA